jgi:hypothetical protein
VEGGLDIDGAILLMDLPSSLPTSLVGTPMEKIGLARQIDWRHAQELEFIIQSGWISS